jgi:nitric oxide dioxygenase
VFGVDRAAETADVVSLALRRTDGAPVGASRPGQYVSVQVALPDGARHIRQYSLSAAPGGKRVRGGVTDHTPQGEVSPWPHAHARPGDLLDVSPSAGDLVLPDGDGPLLRA